MSLSALQTEPERGEMPGPEVELLPFEQLYLHIPFCRHKCGYCDFNAYAGMDHLASEYVDALLLELSQARARYRFSSLRSLYLGGGTPSLLEPELIRRLLQGVRDLFTLDADAEVTLEANPSSTDEPRLDAWLGSGVNRLSFGVQSFDPKALGVLERRSDGRSARRAFTAARAAGFQNLSIDLIYAVPGQGEASLERTIDAALALGPDHISAYALTFEPGTLLHRRLTKGEMREVQDDRQWELMDLLVRRLKAGGFERYEVSSFARSGFQSRHNQGYWECRGTYGAGAGAHSYAGDGELAWRWWNLRPPRQYMASARDPRAGGEALGARLAAAERVMLGLRHTAGVILEAGFEPQLAQLQAQGLIRKRGSRWTPTRRGLDLHNQIALAVL